MALGPSAPSRWGPTWAEFLRSQAKAILATDFFTVTLLNGATVYVLAIIEHASQRVRILGVTAHPDNRWVTQMARNLIMEVGEHAEAVTFLIRDRDTKFTAAFDRMFADAGLKILRSPVRAPCANAIMERWIGSCRRELLDRTLIWNQGHLLAVLRDYGTRYNKHRPHRALQQAAPLTKLSAPVTDLDLSPDLAAEAARHARTQSGTPFEKPWPLSAWPKVPTRFLLCRHGRFFPAEFQRKVVAERLAIVPDEMDGGHLPALGRPHELVRRLEYYRSEER